ncbi:TPA: 1,6-anhydro-N-acetylmuramyl-L-alanine amidase AmpD [Pseudomonas aeruginosa]|nr:1,6-anhydro-N-acetylmuramyl-L-alanine amidase AmpD [Pseudomonas aeruginosa]
MHFDSVTGWVRGVRHCPSPNFNLRPQGDAVSLLVIHNISLPPGQFGTGKVQAFFQNRLDPNEHPYFEEIRHLTVSAHFLIERDGAITQFVSCHDRAWHAGVSCFDGREACNDFSLGIELQSLTLLGSGLQIRRGLESLNDLLQINAVIGQSGKAGDLEARIADVQKGLRGRLEALAPLSEDGAAVAEFEAQRDRLLNGLQAVEAEGSLQGKGARAEKLLGSAQVFIKLLIAQAGLSQDSQRQVRQLSELVGSITPEVTAAISKGRAIGAYSLGQGFLNSSSSARLDELLLEFEKLHGEYGLKLQESLAGSPPALEEAAQASRETLKSLGQLFEDRVIVAETLDTPWTQFYDQVSAAMDKTYQLDDAVLGYLDTQLQKRLQQVRTQMLLLVAALAVVFAAILYLYGGFYVSTRATLKDLGRMMERVAGGDMTVSFQARSRDELGELGQSFNESVAKIHDLIERVSQTVGEVERQTLRVESVSAESNQAVAGQRSQIEQVATAMNQMAATAQEVARSAAMAVSSANSVNQETLSGRSLVESQVGSIQRLAGEIDQSVAAINRLASDSASISQVLDVIKGIAEQTNLLALNAAIEAARAGEQGRGFAVVADEVRTLAKRTQQSTAEIEQMILRLQGGVDAAVKAMGSSHHTADGTVNESAQVQQALENILGAVGMIVDQNQQIAAAAEQQTAVAHDIDQNIVEINQAGERTAEGASQTERASRELGAQVTQLKRLIGAFRV